MNFSSQHRRPSTLMMDLTPLLDVVFLLLIFFVLTTTFVQNPGIEVDLPSASSSQMAAQEEALIISITREGLIVHEGQTFTEQEMAIRLKTYATQRPNATVIIQADEGSRHGLVVTVLDLAKANGFKRLAIATEEK